MADLREQLQSALGSNYTIDRELAPGGMSRVLVARDIVLRRDVVIKVLPPELLAGVNVERFRREILLAAGLQHPHIVPVLAAGETDGAPWFTMPFVDGESLRQRLARGPLSIAETLTILREVAKALAYAHERGVVHRDIKPDNILLSAGTAVVTDFGIAKALSAARLPAESPEPLTQIGISLGTPAYMAPEQAAGDPDADARADIYSFGCVAYELLSGRPPFVAPTPQKLLAAHLAERPRDVTELRADTPPALAALVMQCLEKDPAHRPATAAMLVHHLDNIALGAATSSSFFGRKPRVSVVLALWAAIFGATWILAKASIVAIGLPSWVLPGALIVAALGLPVMLFTAIVQRAAYRTPTLTPGGQVERSTMTTLAMRAVPHVSWSRTMRGGIVAFGAFILLVAAFMTMRALGIGPAGSLLASGKINDRDKLLLAEFSFTGADSLLGRAVTEAIRTDLSESNVIQLLPASVVRQTLTLMEKPPATAVDSAVATGIAVRAGAKAYLTGHITPVGKSYLLTASLIASSTGDVLAAFRESASSDAELLPAVGRLSRSLRGKLGESLRRVQNAEPLTRVTTSSLDALRLYAEGLHLGDDLGQVPRGHDLLLEATQKDSTFAMAWRKLATWANNAGDASATIYAKHAADNLGHLPPSERYLALSVYYDTPGYAFDEAKMVEVLSRAVAEDSDNATAEVNLGIQLAAQRKFVDADRVLRHSMKLGNAYGAYHLVGLFIDEGRLPAAESALVAAHARAENFPYRQAIDLALAGAERKFAGVDQLTRARSNTFAIMHLGHARLAAGRLRAAHAAFEEGIDSSLASGDSAMALDARATESMVESMILNHPAAAAAALRDAEQRFALEREPLVRRPYYNLATAYTMAGQPDRAAQLIRMADAEDTAGLRNWFREPSIVAHATLALATGKAADAIAVLHAPYSCSGTLPRYHVTQARCPVAFLGEAYDRAGQRDSAIAALERYVNTPHPQGLITDGLFLAPSLQRLGELYEAAGNRAQALRYYQEFVEQWKNADPELQPRVAEVRARVQRLMKTEAR